MDTCKRPIHCSDLKREVIYIKDDDKWSKEDDEKHLIKKAIKDVILQQNYVFSLAHAFEEEGLLDYAIDVYKKARKDPENANYPFYYEVAVVSSFETWPCFLYAAYLCLYSAKVGSCINS